MRDTTTTVVTTGLALLGAAASTYLVKRYWNTIAAKSDSKGFFIGIDLGATNAKAAVVRDDGELIAASSEPLTDYTDKGVVAALVKVATNAVNDAGLKFTDICEIGVGSPGTIDFDVGHWGSGVNHAVEWCCDQGLQLPHLGSRSPRQDDREGDWSLCTIGGFDSSLDHSRQ